MTRYLLDTNIASCIIKGNSPAVDRRLVKVAMAQLAISAVTEGELRFRAARLPDATSLHNMIEDFFLRVAVLPWDSAAAQEYGQLRATLEREGQPMGNLDTMIVAHALALDAVLVTNDHAFARIKKLKVADWTKSPRP
ncbi:MAG: type II toxin-antitoxin system VapC family toxin [Terriglobales bacterium]|jgi:tRNA(fMet)-specific endonuclease VapC